MRDLWERSPALVGAAAAIVLGTLAATFGGAAAIPQRVEVALAAIVVELYAAMGAATDRAWAVMLAVIDAGALVVAFRIHHTSAKLLLGIPAIAALALAVIHAITMDAGTVPDITAPSPHEPEPDAL